MRFRVHSLVLDTRIMGEKPSKEAATAAAEAVPSAVPSAAPSAVPSAVPSAPDFVPDVGRDFVPDVGSLRAALAADDEIELYA